MHLHGLDLERSINQTLGWMQSVSTFPLFTPLWSVVWELYMTLIVLPLVVFYLSIPETINIGIANINGGWSGKAYGQICYELTNYRTRPEFWEKSKENMEECFLMVLSKFNEGYMFWVSFIYMIVLSTIVYLVTKRFISMISRSIFFIPQTICKAFSAFWKMINLHNAKACLYFFSSFNIDHSIDRKQHNVIETNTDVRNISDKKIENVQEPKTFHDHEKRSNNVLNNVKTYDVLSTTKQNDPHKTMFYQYHHPRDGNKSTTKSQKHDR